MSISEPNSSVISSSVVETENAEELVRYRAYVASISGAADGKIILNRSAEHAAVIVEYLFLSSKIDVRILTSEFSSNVYGVDAVIRSAIKFLEANSQARIRIISEKEISKTHSFLEALSNLGMLARVEIFHIPDALQKTYGYNFAVGDGHHFRFEKDRRRFDAVVQFGAPSVGSKLNSVFSKLQKEIQSFPGN